MTGDIYEAKKRTYVENHIPSTVNPDTLFTFTSDLKWLMDMLKMKAIFPRYCDENISYLNIKQLKALTIPMRCFCDISLSKLSIHMETYGHYGIAFPKKWGQDNGVQPIQYINELSNLRKDMTVVLRKALQEITNSPYTESDYKNFILHELMYYKPYQGMILNRNTKKKTRKCFADEREWRYIPDLKNIEMPSVIPGKLETIEDYNNALSYHREIALGFNYNDIKHVIIPNMSDYEMLLQAMENWGINSQEKNIILSKLIVWDEMEGDL